MTPRVQCTVPDCRRTEKGRAGGRPVICSHHWLKADPKKRAWHAQMAAQKRRRVPGATTLEQDAYDEVVQDIMSKTGVGQ